MKVSDILQKYSKSRENLLSILHDLQNACKDKCLKMEDLIDVAEHIGVPCGQVYGIASFYSMFSFKPRGKYIIRICGSPSCDLMGSTQISKEIKKILGIAWGETTEDGLFTLEKSSCLGLCEMAPALMINGKPHGNLTPKKISEIISGMKEKIERKSSFVEKGIHDCKIGRKNILLEKCFPQKVAVGENDSAKFEALEKIFTEKISPEKILSELKESGLRGRGGAGFPAYLKWESAKNYPSKEKYIICNADEGEPGTSKDRILMENNPRQILEAMIIAGYVVGASRGYVYVRGEYEHSFEKLVNAAGKARERNYLGKNILGSGFDFDMEMRKGAGAYVCGDETALLESIEGKRGNPRIKPPFPTEYGLWENPALINNVETFFNIPEIVLYGGKWFRTLGTEKSSGTKLFTVSGKVQKPCVTEAEMGTTLKKIIEHAGGMKDEMKFKSALVGGASGTYLTKKQLNVSLDFESLKEIGAVLGSGSVLVIDEESSILTNLRAVLEFFLHESCGQCSPCRIGTRQLVELLETFETENELNEMIDICELMKSMSLCPLGQSLLNPVKSAVQNFSKELVREKKLRKSVEVENV
ncbi:NAD(P)H-dependent oxidoreductase subunit E [candidate division WOR-3 bacterium]|nr:NAD(P)H-dependent oxidoreductase subunit E [candidate division WOR-3 bacterium]